MRERKKTKRYIKKGPAGAGAEEMGIQEKRSIRVRGR